MSVFLCPLVDYFIAICVVSQGASCSPAQFFTFFEEGRRNVCCTLASSQSLSKNSTFASKKIVNSVDHEMAMIPCCLASERQYEEATKEYRSASLYPGDRYMRACYVLLRWLEFSSSALIAEINGVQCTAQGLSLPPITAGANTTFFEMPVER